MDSLLPIWVALAAALASPIGGALALWRQPTSLFMSLTLGFAAGVLLGTVSFEMVPKAQESTSLVATIASFTVGFAAVYALDLYINRASMAGDKADQRGLVRRYHRRHKPKGDEVTVLAGATSAEELIEGLTIGVGAAIDPKLAVVVGAAIVIDNLAEALSIGQLVGAGQDGRAAGSAARTMKWTGLIGLSLFASALVGWLLLGALPPNVLGALFAAGAGAMFYLTVTDLLPEAEERQYQQSAGLAIGVGFVTVLAVASVT